MMHVRGDRPRMVLLAYLLALGATALLTLYPVLTQGQQADQDLAKELANPIANLVSVPIQFNYDSGYGVTDGS